ncbi:MAG: GUN4 domain-containing protein [Cyanobacteria bacterium P01_C01_bin.72]
MMNSNKITQLTLVGALSTVFASSLLAVTLSPLTTKTAIAQVDQVLSPEEVNLRAKQIIVRIDGASVGSGSILERTGNNYTVLSNWHVMKNQGSYIVQTIDGRKHEVIPSSIKQLPGLDLALFEFSSNQNYQVAELGDSSRLSEGQTIYFAGYPGELRREDNRYYRFFTANLVGILPRSTENGYSLIYNGEAFPGMSGGPVFNREGMMIGVHGEANIHALSGATSNYAIPIASYQQAIAKLNSAPKIPAPIAQTPPPEPAPEIPAPIAQTPTPEATPEVNVSPTPAPVTPETSVPQPEENPEIIVSPEVSSPPVAEIPPTPEKPANNQPAAELNSENISSVPTFSPIVTIEPESTATPETQQSEVATQPQAAPQPEATEAEKIKPPEAAAAPPQPEVVETVPVELEEIYVPTVSRKIALVSPRTGIDYTKLRNLLKEEKWSEADIHTYKLMGQIIKSAKLQKKRTFIELKTIAEYSCPDVRTVDSLWKKYSDNQFGFSQQQQVWRSVNQEGDFSTKTWRRFATKVGWKEGAVEDSSGYLLYEQLDFEPTAAPAGHLPWWFALPDESQKVIKYLFARCNLNPTDAELEAEARQNSEDTAQNPDDSSLRRRDTSQPDINKPPKSPDN